MFKENILLHSLLRIYMKNFTIKQRLLFATGCLSFLLVVTGIGGLYSLSTNNHSTQSIYNDNLLSLVDLNIVNNNLLTNQLTLSNAVEMSQDQVEASVQSIAEKRSITNETWKHYMTTVMTPREKEIAEEFIKNREAYSIQAFRPALKLLQEGNKEQAIILINGSVQELFKPINENLKDLISIQASSGKIQYDKSQDTFTTFLYGSISIILFGLIVAISMTIWLVTSISKPLNKAVEIANNVSKGDLTQHIEVTSTDETGQLLLALKTMTENLRNIVSQVRLGTDTIATASSEIASGNLDLSSRTEQQASSLEETASSMEEITSTVKHNSANAQQANQLSMKASQLAVKGGEVVDMVIQKMQGINDSSKQMSEIISVIDNIAFQTNILSLNASVEAARAGDQGRGFAVVASEVRNLAQRSAQAAKEIKLLIANSVVQIHSGSDLVNEAGQRMTDIVTSIKHVSDIMAEISTASREQESGIEQINQAISEMDNVTQQNAALVEEAAAAAESLQDQAITLTDIVATFKV